MNHTLRLSLVIFPIAMLFSAGCGKKNAATRVSTTVEASVRDTETGLLAPLEATPDLEHCKSSLAQLDASEASVAGRPQPTPEETAEFTRLAKLTEAETAEFSQKTFSPGDAAYLEQSLMLRAAVRSLEISGKTPLEQGRAVFDWVCRMVYVNDRVPWPGPPGLTLETGYGTSLARAYLLVAAWRQLGLTGCFIGPKSLRDAAPFVPGDGVADRGSNAPVRLCGLKIDKEVFLFNHVTGEPLFVNDRTKPVKWSELSANLELGKSVADVGQVSQWKVFLAYPLPALSARMNWLQGYDPGRIGVTLSVDFPKILKEYQTDLGTAAVEGWFPPKEADTFAVSPLRVQNRYAAEEGKAPRSPGIKQEHRIATVPLETLPQTGLDGIALGSIRLEYSAPFLNLHYGQNSATQHLIRGQFKEATTQLSDVRSTADSARTRADQDPMLKADFVRWSKQLQELSKNALFAGRSGDQIAELNARQNLEAFFKEPRNQETQRAWVQGHASRPLLAESTYLLALCVHERTLRMQSRSNSPDPGAWKTVLDWWNRYLDISTQVSGSFQSRDAQAKRLKGQAEVFAVKK